MILLLFVLIVLASAVAQGKGGPKKFRQGIGVQEILAAETRLAELGYWTGPVDGTLDTGSRHALVAFQKVEGRQRNGRLNREELRVLLAAARPVPRETGYAHIEIDLARQVLFIVDTAGLVTHVLPVCTGNEKSYLDHGQLHKAHTPRGNFTVVRKIRGWRRSTLGLLYYPNYLHEGVAIHGSLSMPVYPASHGCIRIPMFASKALSEMTPVGTPVLVY